MRKSFITAAAACMVGMSVTLNSCVGSFALTNKLLAWNNTIGDKFINELVFFAFLVVPVYEVSSLADLFVLNSIEFWSGTSPVACNSRIVEGNDSRYLVENDENGYTVTRLADGSQTRFNFHADKQEWTVVGDNGKEQTFLIFVDDTHVQMPGCDGSMQTVELSRQGVFAYQSAQLGSMLPAADVAQK